MTTKMEYHNPVLLKETVDGLNIHPDGVYVDVTFGGGGHSREIMSRLGEKGKLFGNPQMWYAQSTACTRICPQTHFKVPTARSNNLPGQLPSVY